MKRRIALFRSPAGAVLGWACIAIAASSLKGQVDTGAVWGTITDQTGSVVPGAQVTLTNEGTAFRATTKTAGDGSYAFSSVKIGTYTVQAEFQGFQKVSHPHIAVDIQQQVVVDLALVPGRVTQTVEVTAAPPLLQTQNASVGQVVNGRAINELPLNGRNFTFLAQLSAGVSPAQNGGGLRNTGSFSANGTQPGQDNYLLDGIDNNSAIIDDRNGAHYVIAPPVDAISEFKLQTTNYSAEIGRAGGAVLNATIKSGTNHFHGDLWEFLRNDKFDAANFFQNAASQGKGEFRQNQFGGTLGGPVKIPRLYNGKNKTFFFGDYEGTRIRQAATFNSTVPTLAEIQSGYTNFSDLITGQQGSLQRADLLNRQVPLGTLFDPATTRRVTATQTDPVTGLRATGTGFARDPFPGNQIPPGRLDPNAVGILKLLPAPNGPGINNNFTSNPVNKKNVSSFDVRVDEDFSERDQMFVRYSFSTLSAFPPSRFPGIADGGSDAGTVTTRAQDAALSETHILSPTLFNEVRFGLSRVHNLTLQPFGDDLSDIPGQHGIPGIPQIDENGGLPAITISNLTDIGTHTFYPSDKFSTLTQVGDNVTKTHHSHTLKTGFELQHINFPWITPPFPRGSFDFNGSFTSLVASRDASTGVAQFLLTPSAATVPNGVNNVGGANQVQASNFSGHDFSRNYFGAYFQDDWKVGTKLTLNLGLRWDYFGFPQDNFGALSNFVPGPAGAGAQFLIPAGRKSDVQPAFIATLAQDGIAFNPTDRYGLSLVTSRHDSFAPRLGFAYQLKPRIVMRAGYGIFYGGIQNVGGGPTLGNNYPFVFTSKLQAPNSTLPITPNNSVGLLENGLLNVPLTVAAVTGNGIGINAFQLHADPSATYGYNFTLQYQLTPASSFEMSYVGSQSRHLLSTHGANHLTQILPPNTNLTNFVPFPDFARDSGFLTTESNSNYNALLLNFERRFAGGFYLLTNYAWSKARTDGADPLRNSVGNRFRAPDLPGFPIQQDYGLADFDIRQIFHFSGGYELPLGPGKRFLGRSSGRLRHITGGWSFNWILTLLDGLPFTVPCQANGAAGLGCNALLVPGQDPYAGSHDVNHFLNPAAFANPPAATSIGQTDFSPLGGAPTQVTGPPFHRLDFSFFKRIKTSEATHLEFRAEFFNLTNTPNFDLPSARNFINTQNFGQITGVVDGANDPREIQFALKFYW